MSYIEDLENKLVAARKRVSQGNEARALKDSAPTLYEIMDTEISLAVNKMTQKEPLSYEDYLSVHGQVVGIRSIRDLLHSKEVEAPAALQEADAIDKQLKQFKQDAKEQK